MSTPIRFAASWPIWFITWWVMWQCSAQSPGSSATNSIVRVVPTGTSTVVSGDARDAGTAPPSVADDLERVAVQVDRVVVHRAEVAEADAHALAGLGDERLRSPGTPCR